MSEALKEVKAEAVLEASRISSTGAPLFGSNIKHHNFIEFRLREAEVVKNADQDWIRGTRILAEFSMTEQQLMRLITNFNNGGTQVTLTHLKGHTVHPLPPATEDLYHDEEIRRAGEKAIESVKNAVPRIEAILEKKSLSAADRAEIRKLFVESTGIMTGSIPYVVAMAQSKARRMAEDAKTEILSFWNSTISRLGVKTLAEKEGIKYE